MPRSRVPLLVLLTTVPALGEALVLQGLGYSAAMGLAPQITAPSSFGIFHDLRWVQVFHFSWWSFAVESVAAIVARSLFNTGVVCLVWTDGVPRRSWTYVLRINLLFNTVVYVVLSPWSAVAVAASDTSLFWFTLGELAPLVFLSLFLQRGPISADWWRRMPSPAEVGWVLMSFVMLSVAALAIYSASGWWRIVIAGVAGAANGWLWRRLVGAALRARISRWIIPVAPIAMVLSAAALLAMGQFSSVGQSVANTPPPRMDRFVTQDTGHEIVYVAGYDSAMDDRQIHEHDQTGLFQFSYRGLGPGGQPLPYQPVDTHESLIVSARQLAAEVDAAHRRGGRPVALVAQSEGTLVARGYLDGYPHPDVDALVLLSPLIQPGRIYFPPATASSGWGIVTGWLLREMFAVVRMTSSSDTTPDEPFVRSILDHATAYRSRLLCPVPGVRTIVFLPFAGAAVAPPDDHFSMPVIELPGLHAGLLGEPDVQHRIAAFLRGRPPGSQPGWGYAAIQRAAGAWQAPALPLRLNPIWHADDQPDPALGDNPCR